jgi:hypothetical protein
VGAGGPCNGDSNSVKTNNPPPLLLWDHYQNKLAYRKAQNTLYPFENEQEGEGEEEKAMQSEQ